MSCLPYSQVKYANAELEKRLGEMKTLQEQFDQSLENIDRINMSGN